jgi:hypothetical protein
MVFLKWSGMNRFQFNPVYPLSKDGNIRLDISDSSYEDGLKILVVFIKKRKRGLLLL